MSGTPVWDHSDCDGINASRSKSDFSDAEKMISALSYKIAAKSNGILSKMTFLKTPEGVLLSDYYKTVGIFGLVKSFILLMMFHMD
jgi:hypothetical protein